jgi:hypothetical protein
MAEAVNHSFPRQNTIGDHQVFKLFLQCWDHASTLSLPLLRPVPALGESEPLAKRLLNVWNHRTAGYSLSPFSKRPRPQMRASWLIGDNRRRSPNRAPGGISITKLLRFKYDVCDFEVTRWKRSELSPPHQDHAPQLSGP